MKITTHQNPHTKIWYAELEEGDNQIELHSESGKSYDAELVVLCGHLRLRHIATLLAAITEAKRAKQESES